MEDTYRHLIEEMNRLGILYQTLKDMSAIGGAVFKKPLRKEMREAFKGLTLQNGDFNKERAVACLTADDGDTVVFGRPFIGNPDLVSRLRHDWPSRLRQFNCIHGRTKRPHRLPCLPDRQRSYAPELGRSERSLRAAAASASENVRSKERLSTTKYAHSRSRFRISVRLTVDRGGGRIAVLAGASAVYACIGGLCRTEGLDPF
jgi:hypothetical protein